MVSNRGGVAQTSLWMSGWHKSFWRHRKSTHWTGTPLRHCVSQRCGTLVSFTLWRVGLESLTYRATHGRDAHATLLVFEFDSGPADRDLRWNDAGDDVQDCDLGLTLLEGDLPRHFLSGTHRLSPAGLGEIFLDCGQD